MSGNNISTYLKYANLQMASEALFGRGSNESSPITISGFELRDSVAMLTTGNKHASRFPPSLAASFLAEGWEVLAHQPNTSTGFSGTLFENKTTHELVLSFRSTEFIDDAVRDTQVTNKGIEKTGWAFGQLADMQAWYKVLSQTGGPLEGKSFVVTGYSLGGHLATAFPMLCPGATAVYTFNGAGVGGLRGETLSSVVTTFQTIWKNTGNNSGLFKDPKLAAIYREFIKNGALSIPSAALLKIANEWSAEAALLYKAIERVTDVQKEIGRIATIDGAAKVSSQNIAGTGLDYWLGVLKAAESTFSENTVQSTLDRTAPRGDLSVPVFNVYGEETANSVGNPSGVANSQNHYGTDVPIFIESQPLFRGFVELFALWESKLYNDVKLLVSNFNENDFGDSHRLVLLVDSLAVQGLFARLAPAATAKQLGDIFDSATASRPETSLLGRQGQAEGYTLETVLDGLIETLTGRSPGLRDISTQAGKSLDTGNTWHDIVAREALHKAIVDLEGTNSFNNLVGKFTPATDSDSARADFGQFLALIHLTPFALKTTDTMALAVLKNANPSLAQAWEADAGLSAAQRAAGLGHYSDMWLADRAAMLSWMLNANRDDQASIKSAKVGDEAWSFRDVDSGGSSDIITDSDGQGAVQWSIGGARHTLAGGKKVSNNTWRSDDGKFVRKWGANDFCVKGAA